MSNLTPENIQAKIDAWYRAEQAGEQFPVPLEESWQMCGYSRIDNAKRRLPKRWQGRFFLSKAEKQPQGQAGRPKVKLYLSCDGLKQLGMKADTKEGDAIRQYFIEAEKRWRKVQEQDPEAAARADAEVLRLQIESQKLQYRSQKLELDTLKWRHNVVTTCDEVAQQRILGTKEIEVVSYRDRQFLGEQLVRDGSTLNKAELCRHFGLMRNSKPDYAALRKFMDAIDLPSEAFELKAFVRENQELRREWLPQLDALWQESERQKGLGESSRIFGDREGQ